MNRLLVVTCWICVVFLGAFVRFDDLAKRPFHADEATGARITASRMRGEGKFDPKHYHGPLFHMIAGAACSVRGESDWSAMRKETLRLVPAVAGTLLLLVPLCWRRRFGDAATLAAAAFLATSPLLAYYSRMFIHEIPLTLAGMLALASLCGKPRPVATGFLLGVMFALKETFAISVIAWTGAGMLVWWHNRATFGISNLLEWVRANRKEILIAGLAAIGVSMLVYTDFLRHPGGAVDAIKTFFVYETVGGHEKPFGYYFELLAVPQSSSGLWWFGTPLVLLGVIAMLLPEKDSAKRCITRFVGYSTLGHLLIYSVIGYKTPWLMCLPVAHLCLLAGLGFSGLILRGWPVRCGLVLLGCVCLASQWVQTRRAVGRFASDARNPFAYVPTRSDVETMEAWLIQLHAMKGGTPLESMAVIGSDYWPLPWYLRNFGKVGYWRVIPEDLHHMPVVFAMPEVDADVMRVLGDSHVQHPYGLRAGVPISMYLRKDIRDQWDKEGAR